MPKSDICVVIPAYNEEKVIETSLQVLKETLSPEDMYVVSDGSTDRTSLLARRQGVNVMRLRKNVGKAPALKKLIKSRHLAEHYRYILFSDADSRLSPSFSQAIQAHIHENPACIVGTVTSDRRGLISAFRTFEYGLSHRVYKTAQNAFKAITVAPGCASLYRSDVLEKLDFHHHTLTEDFDLTIQIYKKRLGNILYVPEARVITQDPIGFRDYWKQIVRWNTGTWQNFFLHHLYRPDSRFNIALYAMLVDNLLWILTAIVVIRYPFLFLRLFSMTYLSAILLGTIIGIIERQWWILPYTVFFPLFYIINIIAYYYSFFRALFSRRRTLAWNKVTRYSNLMPLPVSPKPPLAK